MTPEEFKEMRQILWQFVPIENYGEALAELEKIARRTVSGQEAFGYFYALPCGDTFLGCTDRQLAEAAAADDGLTAFPLYAAPIPATEQEKP